MKAVIFNGSNEGNSAAKTVQKYIEAQLAESGWELDLYILDRIRIAPCMGCFGCWFKTPGVCLIDDAGRDIARAYVQSDLAVFLTPVTFGGYSSELKKAVDRLIPVVSPRFMKINGETHHRPRYERYPAFAAIGIQRNADEESEGTFRRLAGRNAINMHSPSHASCIVLEEDWSDQIRQKVARCLGSVGVAK